MTDPIVPTPDTHPTTAALPDGRIVAFPDSMKPEDIHAATSELHAANTTPAPIPDVPVTPPVSSTPPTALTGPVKPPVTAKDVLSKPDPFSIPVYQHPDVVNAMSKAWDDVLHGQGGMESSFVVHSRKPDGTPVIRPIKGGNDYHKETFDIGPGDTDIIHTHPDRTDPFPSDADMAIANKYNVNMYTVSKAGVYRYSPGMKKAELVQTGLDFLNQKPSMVGVLSGAK